MRSSMAVGASLAGLCAVLALAGPALANGFQKIYADLIRSPIRVVKHGLGLTYGEHGIGQSLASKQHRRRVEVDEPPEQHNNGDGAKFRLRLDARSDTTIIENL